jgi:hypothetical protein
MSMTIFVVAQHHAGRVGAGVGNVEDLEERRHVALVLPPVSKAGIAEVEHEVGLLAPKRVEQLRVIVEVAEPVALERRERSPEVLRGGELLLPEHALRRVRVGQAWIPQDDAHVQHIGRAYHRAAHVVAAVSDRRTPFGVTRWHARA